MKTPMPRNPSISPSPELRADLEEKRGTVGVSARLNQIWQRYALICQDVPEFSERERSMLEQALEGVLIDERCIRYLDQELVEITRSMKGDPTAWLEVISKIRSLNIIQRVALLEILSL